MKGQLLVSAARWQHGYKSMVLFVFVYSDHRHLSNIDCLTAHTACLVCFISTVNGGSNKKKKRKEKAYPWKAGASNRHITNLKQSILETFEIYALDIALPG